MTNVSGTAKPPNGAEADDESGSSPTIEDARGRNIVLRFESSESDFEPSEPGEIGSPPK